MSRRPHIIRADGGAHDPDCVVIVQAATHQQFESDADAWGTASLEVWCARAIWHNGTVRKEPDSVEGATVAEFWQWFMGVCQYAGRVIVLSHHARETLAILGLWDRLISGDASLIGGDPWARDGIDGYVILQSPPTVVCWLDNLSRTRCTWLDPANHGCKTPATSCQQPWTNDADVLPMLHHAEQWYRTYDQVLTMVGIGPLEHTSAAQAASGYRRTFMAHPIYIHDNEPILKLERAAGYGGRNECCYVGRVYAGESLNRELTAELPSACCGGLYYGADDCPDDVVTTREERAWQQFGPIWQLDVNSLYPAVAADSNLPTELECAPRHISVKTLLEACRCLAVVADVRVKVNRPCVPVEHNGQTVYPVGTFRTVLCGPEILLAAEHGHILAVHQAAAYKSRPIYRKWVEQLYLLRLQLAAAGNHDHAAAIKAILNSSFGKWAAQSRRWESARDRICHQPWSQWFEVDRKTREIEQWRCMAWSVQRAVVVGEAGDSFPAINSYIQSLGRVRLWRLLEIARKGTVLYYDTDSIWCDSKAFNALAAAGELHATELGKLKTVGQYHDVEFMGQKRYIADGKVTCAGIDGSCVRRDGGHVIGLRARPIGSFLRSHQAPNTDYGNVRVRLTAPYTAGTVNAGGLVSPITLNG